MVAVFGQLLLQQVAHVVYKMSYGPRWKRNSCEADLAVCPPRFGLSPVFILLLLVTPRLEADDAPSRSPVVS